jgi:NAD-dependent DNA ligase
VVDVIWQASKDGYLKPRVQVMPIKLGGVTIQYATGFNADFIEKNKIGVGAVIQIIRSGDVIPYIKAVTTPAENPKMPDEAYRWNDTHIDIILENIGENATVREKLISAFFKGIEVDGLGPGNVKKMIASGFDTVPKILRMTEADLLTVEGFQQKTAKKLHEGIQNKIDQASLATLMSASQKFGRGFGITKIELIMEKYPEVLNDQERNIQLLAAIPGIGDKTATEFVERIPLFLEFMKECGLEEKIKNKIVKIRSPTTNTNNNVENLKNVNVEPVIDTTNPLYGKTIVMSGFRDKELEAILKQKGMKVSSNIKKDILALLVSSLPTDETQVSGKIKEAREKNISIMTVAEFREKYMG